MTQNKIDNLIVKFLEDRISMEESKLLTKWLNDNEQNQNYFNDFVEIAHLTNAPKAFDHEEALRRTRLVFNRRKKTKPNFFRYVVAAVIVLFVALVLSVKDNFAEIDAPPPVTVNPIIQPGTDRAILTLEDGSQVALEKGKTFQTDKLKSEGEGIVYKDSKDKHREVLYNYLTIPRGGQFFIQLSDSTKVWLNSESKLKYPVEFPDGQDRVVELVYGEAYFDVSPSTQNKGSGFIVKNQRHDIAVLGTEFNVKAYNDEQTTYTTLVEGKVTVKSPTFEKTLKPSQQSKVFSGGKVEVDYVDVYTQIAWKDGVFKFVDKPLKDIMKVIARWYDVDITFLNKELETKQFIGTIKKDQGIEEILSIMKSSSINTYQVNDRTIILQ